MTEKELLRNNELLWKKVSSLQKDIIEMLSTLRSVPQFKAYDINISEIAKDMPEGLDEFQRYLWIDICYSKFILEKASSNINDIRNQLDKIHPF